MRLGKSETKLETPKRPLSTQEQLDAAVQEQRALEQKRNDLVQQVLQLKGQFDALADRAVGGNADARARSHDLRREITELNVDIESVDAALRNAIDRVGQLSAKRTAEMEAERRAADIQRAGEIEADVVTALREFFGHIAPMLKAIDQIERGRKELLFGDLRQAAETRGSSAQLSRIHAVEFAALLHSAGGFEGLRRVHAGWWLFNKNAL